MTIPTTSRRGNASRHSCANGRVGCATLCYMSEPEHNRRVGVRELRQNLSVYLERVKAGESLEVTERGLAVARLAPLERPSGSIVERLVREGRAREGRGNLSELGGPKSVGAPSLSDVLDALRDEEDR